MGSMCPSIVHSVLTCIDVATVWVVYQWVFPFILLGVEGYPKTLQPFDLDLGWFFGMSQTN